MAVRLRGGCWNWLHVTAYYGQQQGAELIRILPTAAASVSELSAAATSCLSVPSDLDDAGTKHL